MVSYLEFAIDTAEKAGTILLSFFNSNSNTVEQKDDRSIVTEADKAADNLIVSAIKKNFPDDLIISEEIHPRITNYKSKHGNAIWVVDPLDGTTNFSLGLYIWGILIARLVNGWPEFAVLYFPLINELYYAQQGQGAFLNHNPIRVEVLQPKYPLPVFCCCSRAVRHYHINVPFKTRIMGSAAYSFCMVARGAALISFEATPKIWDIAAPWLLIEQAGGVINTLNNSQPFPLEVNLKYDKESYPTIAASSIELASKAHRWIIPKGEGL